MNSGNVRFTGFAALGIGAALFPQETLGQLPCPVEISGSNCVCSESVSDITICAEWTGLGEPEAPSDFFVDFNCPGCPGAPDVQLKTGSTWTVRSRNSNGSFGDIGTLSSPWPQDFNVKLGTGYSDPGAQNVGSIDLDPTGVMGDPNYANIVGGAIRGNLTGSLAVSPNSSGIGGECTLFIDGTVQGKVSIEVVQDLSIFGSTSAAMTIGEIAASGQLVIGNPLSDGCGLGTPAVSAPIAIGAMAQGASLIIHGPLVADLTVEDSMGAGADVVVRGGTGDVNVKIPAIDAGAAISVVQFGNPGGTDCALGGTLTMAGGIGESTGVQIFGKLARGASINLNGQDVAGLLYIRQGGSGAIIKGGAVTDGAIVTLADFSTQTFTGSATFSKVDPGAIIHTDNAADMNGTLTVDDDMSGTVNVQGSLMSRGRILVDGLCDGAITIGEETSKLSLIHITGGLGEAGSVTVNNTPGNNFNANGDIYVGPTKWTQMPDVTFDGNIQINKGAGNGDLNGNITVVGCHDDDLDICVEGTVNGDVTLIQAGSPNTADWCCSPPCS